MAASWGGPAAPAGGWGSPSARPGADTLVRTSRIAAPKARSRAAAPNPLLDPSQPLQGKALQDAATALTNAQIKGPLAELAKQLANNRQQTAGAQKATSGYFTGLGNFTKQGSQQETGIANDLNSQLAGIQNDTQGRIAGFGQQATQTPGLQSLAASGLDGGALGNLAAETARQQGLAAQNAGTYRSFGANEGGNYRGLAASQLGTFAQAGQEALGRIAAAGQQANLPINSKIADLQATRGSLLATNEGKLRQQEISNAITQAGIQAGLTKAQIAAMQSNINNQRTTSTSAANNAATNATSAANNAATNRQSGLNAQGRNRTSSQNNIRNNQNRGGTGATGGTRPLTAGQNIGFWGKIGRGLAAYGKGRSQGLSPQQIQQQALAAGYSPLQAQVVAELWTYRYLNPSTAAQLHNAGVRGGSLNGKPIRVGSPPPGPPPTGLTGGPPGGGTLSIGY